MSKRQLNSRIKNLFAELGDESLDSRQSEDALLEGWTWEADVRGNYTAVSTEINHYLKYPEARFIGQPLDFGLDPKSAQTLEHALTGSQFPIEVELEYVTQTGAHLATRTQIYPIPWLPETPFQIEAIHGWRATPMSSPECSWRGSPSPDPRCSGHPHEPGPGDARRPRAGGPSPGC